MNFKHFIIATLFISLIYNNIIMSYICIDYSGSTGNCEKYWRYVSQVVETNTDSNIIFWDTQAQKVSHDEARRIINKRSGNGGTSPDCLIGLLPEKANVVIVTDGQIDQSSVAKCDNLLNNREFENVQMHFFDTGGRMDLSVSAPFTRKANYTIYKDGTVLATGSTKKQIDLSEYANNPNKFVDDSESLLQQVIMLTMGRPNIPLRNEILNLKDKMLNFIAKSKSDNMTDQFGELRTLLKNQDYEQSLEFMKNLITSQSSGDLAKNVERITHLLINQCANSKNFSFDMLEPSRIMRANVVESVADEELPKVKNYEGQFECPILFDVDSPCCLVKAGEPVLQGLENSYLNDLIANPLLLLTDETLVNKLKSRLDHVFGLEAVNKLFENGTVKSPITRDDISCVLTFGFDKTHTKSMKYTLANLLFGNKLVGSPGLWLAVIYFVTSDVNYLASNEQYVASFKDYLVKRFTNQTSKMTLTGLPIEPMLKCPSDIAVWFCVTSPLIMNPNSIENRLRDFKESAVYLTKLLDLFNYPYDKEFTENRLKLYSAFNWMMFDEKNNKYEWRNMVRTIYQNSKVLSDGTIIMLDGESTNKILPLVCQQLKDYEVVGLAKLVDRSRKNENVNIPKEFNTEVPQHVVNYSYKDTKVDDHRIPICPKTLRPYMTDRQNGLVWEKSADIVYGQLSGLLSANHYFIRFVEDNNKYPTRDEYIKYMFIKQQNKGVNPKDTLPKRLDEFVDEILEEYQKVLGSNYENISVEDFLKTTQASLYKNNRELMEKS